MNAPFVTLEIVIEGVTDDGRAFRPSDWVERLIDTASVYGRDRRAHHGAYSGPERRRRQIAFLEARMLEGRKCLVVDGRLREANPQAYAFVMEFARSNRLRWRETNAGIDPASAHG